MKVTSIERLREIAQGEVVELPGFVDNEPFVARLKRPALMELACRGSIPNPLLPVANALFNGKPIKGDVAEMKEIGELLHIVADVALVSPAMKELEEMGLSLTDMQLMAIFSYTQVGLKGLERFHTVEGSPAGTEPKRKA